MLLQRLLVGVQWILLGCIAVLVAAHADEADDARRRRYEEWSARWDFIDKTKARINATKPAPRYTPARQLNISDEEVREIELSVHDSFPHSLVNISTVVTGCPCEEGRQCTDQVWLLAFKDRKSYGMLMSKINGHWTIGKIQQWWLHFNPYGSDLQHYQLWDLTYAEAEAFPICEKKSSALQSLK